MSTLSQPATLSKRLHAFALDYLVISGYAVILAALTIGLVAIAKSMGKSLTWPADPFRADLLAFLTLVLPVILTFMLQESSPRQATLGKQKVGLVVEDAGGGRLTRKRAFVRSFLKFLPWQIAHTSLFHIEGWPSAPANPSLQVTAGFMIVWAMVAAYLGSIVVTKDHRTPYDRIAGAYVMVLKTEEQV